MFLSATTASRWTEKPDRVLDIQAPLVHPFQAIDLVAQHSVSPDAEWTPITIEATATAKQLLTRLYDVVAEHGELWQSPHVASDAEGAITFEWWRGTRTLTLFAYSDQTTSYLLAWGLNIWTEMETGDNPDNARLFELWLRLNES
jgi:hypothetical protein